MIPPLGAFRALLTHPPPRLSPASPAALRQPRLWLLAAVLALVLAVPSWGAAEAQSPRGAIENLRLTSPNAGELVIKWGVPSETPTDYRLVYAPADQGYPSYRDENTAEKGNAYPTANTHTVADLPHGTEYKVLVRARYSDGNPPAGPWSDQATITISSPPEPQPQRDATPVAQAPTATIAANSAAITEGGNAVFTVTLNPAPSSDVSVSYNLALAGDYGVAIPNNRVATVKRQRNHRNHQFRHHRRRRGRGQRRRHRRPVRRRRLHRWRARFGHRNRQGQRRAASRRKPPGQHASRASECWAEADQQERRTAAFLAGSRRHHGRLPMASSNATRTAASSSTGADRQCIERVPVAHGDSTPSAADGKYSYKCTGLNLNTRYYGRVQALNGAAERPVCRS